MEGWILRHGKIGFLCPRRSARIDYDFAMPVPHSGHVRPRPPGFIRGRDRIHVPAQPPGFIGSPVCDEVRPESKSILRTEPTHGDMHGMIREQIDALSSPRSDAG